MFFSKSIDKEGIVALRVDVDGRHAAFTSGARMFAGSRIKSPGSRCPDLTSKTRTCCTLMKERVFGGAWAVHATVR